MNTPAVSEAFPSAPLALPSPPARAEAITARAGAAARGRLVAAPWPSRRPAPSGPNPAWEIVAGVLVLVAWAMLWSFFLTAVVEPGATLHRDPDRRAALSRQRVDP
jgi:hypothetical protein